VSETDDVGGARGVLRLLLLLDGSATRGGALMDWDCIVCAWCERVTADWVCWSTTYVEHFAYFCSNNCLMQWLVHLPAQVED
jgi:hypothetical protein